MSVNIDEVEKTLSIQIPFELVQNLIRNYNYIKQQFFLGKYLPSELNAARFGECVLRIIEFVDTGTYTSFGKQLESEKIINRASNNIKLPDGIRQFIPKLTRILLDVRNKRNVAHVGGEVDPNYSDSLFVNHCADWILIEIIRNYHTNSIDEAKKIVDSINDTKIPIVAEIDGFIRIQNTKLDTLNKTLIILYHRHPNKVLDKDIAKWLKYNNISRFKIHILKKLDNDALIHYFEGSCSLLPKGALYVEKNINLELIT